jgi:phenylpropionate dioxygenase-like ring-hydroxylating dioxygenase large terminal subunit
MKTLFTFAIGFGLALASLGGSTNQTTSADLLEMRTYKVSTDTFVAHLKHLLPPKAGESDTELLVRFFKQKHVEIKPPESIFLNEKMSLLFARATQADQKKIEHLVTEIVGH